MKRTCEGVCFIAILQVECLELYNTSVLQRYSSKGFPEIFLDSDNFLNIWEQTFQEHPRMTASEPSKYKIQYRQLKL